MADDHRSRDDDHRYGQANPTYGQQGRRDQDQYGQAGGYSQDFGPAQGGHGSYGGGYGGHGQAPQGQQGFTHPGYGQQNHSGGSTGYDDNRWRGGGQGGQGYAGYGPAGQRQGGQAGGYGAPSHGQAYGQGRGEYGGPPQGFRQDDQGYTGQTGTGYGHTVGGERHGGDDQPVEGGRSWWEKTKDFLSGDERPASHRGRGPKTYSRSDERIQDDVNDRLTDDPFLDATNVEVAVAQGEVTLTGTVSSRADKRRAEDLADNVSGVKHVQNNLRVESAASS
jgi:hypothetical protein